LKRIFGGGSSKPAAMDFRQQAEAELRETMELKSKPTNR